MRHREVGSLMAADVVAVTAPTSSATSADLMERHRINGLPVVDAEDRVVGMLSATDLRRRWFSEDDSRRQRHRGRLLRTAGRSRKSAYGAARNERTAGEVMSAPAVVVHAEQSIAEAARTMAGRGVERLPVVDEENRLVGIVTRRDLLAVFLRPDAEIHREVTETVLGRTMGLAPDRVDVRVDEGVVTLKGHLERAGELPVVIRLVEQVDGVVSVVHELTGPAGDRPRRGPGRTSAPGLSAERPQGN